MGRLFGTDGVRGIANRDLTCELAFKLGQAGAYALTDQIHKPRILIGRDTRVSGTMLEAALVAGICSVGAEAMVAGVITTPAVAMLTRSYKADAGIMVSASHNTIEYNGIKFFDSRGYKLPDETENRIEAIILDGAETIALPDGLDVGRRVNVRSARNEYIDFLVSKGEPLNGLKIALDCANGSASEIAPVVFEKLGAEVLPYFSTPDGSNINKGCGSTDPKMLQQLVCEMGADVGLAFDGDADRLIAVDEMGNIIDGDIIMYICAKELKERGLLKKNTLVVTVMSNIGLDIAAKNAGIALEKTAVGDRYVLERMLERGCNLGGEQSGHIIFLDHNTTGDGILSAIQLLNILARKKQRLSKIASEVKIYPQVLKNAHVEQSAMEKFRSDEEIAARITALEKKYAGRGRVLIRPSGTEPKIRVMIEGDDEGEIAHDAYSLAKFIEERLNRK